MSGAQPFSRRIALFDEAVPQSIDVQDDGEWAIVTLAARTSLMAVSSATVSDEIYDVIRPIIREPLPQNQAQRRQLTARLDAAYMKMREISWRPLSAGTSH